MSKKKLRFEVIIEVPEGTLAWDPIVYLQLGRDFIDPPVLLSQKHPEYLMVLRTPVFHVGEILIVDRDGREVSYPGRKSSKWDVTSEFFDDCQAAVVRSQEVSK